MAFIKFKPLTSRFYFHSILNADEIKEELKQYLTFGESVISAYKATRDLCVITNKRIILIDKKGIRGFCKTIYSIRYGTISSYALNIHSIDSSIDITIESGYKLSIYFVKPIPLDDMFNLYKHITDLVLKQQ